MSSVSTSPRPSTALSRPHWPWTPHTHSASSSSLPSVSASPGGPQHSASWEAGSSTSNTARNSIASVSQMQSEDPIRQWNFIAFEWTVRSVHALRDWVEQTPLINDAEGVEEPHEILRESPIIADGKFKLEIADLDPANPTPVLTPPPPGQDSGRTQQPNKSINIPTLSLCITSMVDITQEYYATMMAAVKVQDDRGGERGARADWVWEVWEYDWSFRQDSEFWECTMPTLSRLLQNQRIAETDSFVICVQIHNPTGPQYPQHPLAYYVPKDLLDGVEASLDNPRDHTGDVKFICLETGPPSASTPPSPLVPTSPNSRRSSSETSGFSFTTQPKARKRYIYAHSDILIRRSYYFHTMLTSSFAENSNTASGERKVYEVVVEEADFVTIYWLLKYCYANWVLFKDHDDPRASVNRTGEGWSAKWLSKWSGGEWDWKSLNKPADDTSMSIGSRDDDTNERSVLSGGSSNVEQHTQHAIAEGKRPMRSPSGRGPTTTSSLLPSGVGPVPSSSTRAASRLTTTTPNTNRITNPSSKSSPRPTCHSSASSSRAPTSYAYPLSPRQTRQPHIPDPHPHPTPQPLPASALSIWSIAHRYSMPGLTALALKHMMNTIQPSSAFPLLLASSRWDDLHALVEDYVVDQWDMVCESEEFERCCQEMATGDWGPEGGRTFAALFRRLKSR
ncbi:hypothetical protein BU17DRAFT_37868 [Hysterangium stoloniferum]|nr:hypothetical protein BU17DRAFT_37868 [Hysterangium stoloniferum]